MEFRRMQEENKETEKGRNELTLSIELQAMDAFYAAHVEAFLYEAPSASDAIAILINMSAISNPESKDEMIPGELALLAFSIKSGIIRKLTTYINHGRKIPKASSDSANMLLELPPVKDEEENYEHTVWTLNWFRKRYQLGRGEGERTLLFCRKSEFRTVTCNLNSIFKGFCALDFKSFNYTVIPLEYLVTQLAKEILPKDSCGNDHLVTSEEALKLLILGPFKETQQGCDYHSDNKRGKRGLYYCPMRTVNQLAERIIGAFRNTTEKSNPATAESVSPENKTSKMNNPPKTVEVKATNEKSPERPENQDTTCNSATWVSNYHSASSAGQLNANVYPGWNPYMAPQLFSPGYFPFQPPPFVHPFIVQPPMIGNYNNQYLLQNGPLPFFPMMPYQMNNFPMSYYNQGMSYNSGMSYNHGMMQPNSNVPVPHSQQRNESSSLGPESRNVGLSGNTDISGWQSSEDSSLMDHATSPGSSPVENLQESLSRLRIHRNMHEGGRPG